MHFKIRGWAATFGLLLLGGIASAQSDSAGSDLGPDAAAKKEADAKTLTPEQMLKAGDDMLVRMDRTARVVRRQLSQARQERDVVKVLCLNDKLNQIDVALASGADRMKTLQSMIETGDVDRARHEYTIVAVLSERVTTLQSEANQCVGEEVGFDGDTEVTFDIDPSVPDDDPSGFPDEPVISEPPILSSPTY